MLVSFAARSEAYAVSWAVVWDSWVSARSSLCLMVAVIVSKVSRASEVLGMGMGGGQSVVVMSAAASVVGILRMVGMVGVLGWVGAGVEMDWEVDMICMIVGFTRGYICLLNILH